MVMEKKKHSRIAHDVVQHHVYVPYEECCTHTPRERDTEHSMCTIHLVEHVDIRDLVDHDPWRYQDGDR